MAQNKAGPEDFHGQEVRNAVIHLLGADPGAPAVGQVWINTAAGVGNYKLKWNDNGTIKEVPSLVQVLGLRLDQFAVPTADLNLNSRKITSLADPVSAQDAATMQWVINLFNGRDWKDSVRVATTANLAALSGLLTIDGITLVAGDRVLVKNQTTAANNGIYVAASGAWARAADADASNEVTANMAMFVSEGSTQADTQWGLTTNDPIVLGTTALSFTQIGASTTYIQGTGISITGATIAIDTTLVPRKYAQDFGDGAATSFTITHNLNTLDVSVSFRKKSTGEPWDFPWNNNGTVNAIAVSSGIVPALNEFRVSIYGAG